MLNIIDTNVPIPSNISIPIIIGIIVFLYSAFSSTLPTIYFIPKNIHAITLTTTPTINIALYIFLAIANGAK